ncbi:diguanylate cyclase (GGDEF)-like protein [Acinetobacter johnsonii]|uniref:GGDEF domain-containing protein n=1 Tax=Acinetobacter johnsonii TaxID=40214 RepID=UPI00161264D3|nr:GGDEF domain-containing protein [Acinetobacter johnsonii]MBB4808739.1 diguanylate cyclase (GGDEF)-like protein [Acinetobacter johnsonii]
MSSWFSISKQVSNSKLSHYLLEEEVIMNWDTLKKCILILVLGCCVNLIWLVWETFVLFNSEYWHVVNVQLLRHKLVINSIFFITLLGLIYPCYALQKQAWVQRFLPYIAIGILIISLCYNGYMIGVFSPVTMVVYICLIAVGLVLFERKIVYAMLIPATGFLTISGYLSFIDVIPYAPIFQIDGQLFLNGFWLLSMLYFVIPILITCLILFEILLSQWRHRERLIQHLSQTDPLTNALNRRSINQSLNELHHDKDCPYAIVLLDLDHFKNINDQFGHHMGDTVLIAVSQKLGLHLRESDVVGRFGGEEFILILKQSSALKARQIAERCRAAIEDLVIQNEDGRAIRITASFGIALATDKLKPQQLLDQADKALYAAKASGRNQIKCYLEINPSEIKYSAACGDTQHISPN